MLASVVDAFVCFFVVTGVIFAVRELYRLLIWRTALRGVRIEIVVDVDGDDAIALRAVREINALYFPHAGTYVTARPGGLEHPAAGQDAKMDC